MRSQPRPMAAPSTKYRLLSSQCQVAFQFGSLHQLEAIMLFLTIYNPEDFFSENAL